jgi:hypothetical protein
VFSCYLDLNKIAWCGFEKGKMIKLFSFVIVTASFVLAIPSQANAGVSAMLTPYKVEVTHTPYYLLIERGKFDVIEIDPEPAETTDQQYGPTELLLVNLGREFESYLDILTELRGQKLVPGTYRDLLEYAALSGDKSVVRRIIAFGTPTKRPSGTTAWQAFGVNESHQRFLGYVVEGDGGWPKDFFYLAKRQPSKPREEFNAFSWKQISNVSTAVSARVAEARKRGENPDRIEIRIRTNLSYRGVALAAYYRLPKSPEEANAVAASHESISIGVLGKALTELNILRHTEKGTDCYASPCRIREVVIPIMTKGMGIIDAPITRDIEYSTKIIYP